MKRYKLDDVVKSIFVFMNDYSIPKNRILWCYAFFELKDRFKIDVKFDYNYQYPVCLDLEIFLASVIKLVDDNRSEDFFTIPSDYISLWKKEIMLKTLHEKNHLFNLSREFVRIINRKDIDDET